MPYYRRNLYLLSATIFLAAMSWNQVVPFLPLFIGEMGVEENLLEWTGIIFALQGAASIFAQPFWGKMGDRFGRKPMAIRAGFCLAGVYFGMALCQTPLQLAVFRFLNGALTGFIPMSLALIGTNTPEERAPSAMATAQTASAVGLIVGPAIGGLLSSLVGYRGAMNVSGAVVLACTVLVWLFVKEVNRGDSGESTSLAQDFVMSVRSRVLSSVMVTVLVYAVYVASLSPILALHLKNMNYRVTDQIIGWVFALPPVALVLTAHFWARLGQRTGYDHTIRIGLIGAGACTLGLAFVNNLIAFAVVFFLSGVFLAALNPSTGSIICTQVHEAFRGRAYGMQQSASMLGVLIAPLLATRIGDAFGLSSVFTFIGVIALVGSVAFTSLARGWSKHSGIEVVSHDMGNLLDTETAPPQ